MAIEFNMLEYAKRLQDAGVQQHQAQVHAQALGEFMGHAVALKSDLLLLKTEILAKIDLLKSEIDTKIEMLRGEIAGIRGEVNLLKWMVGGSIALNLAIIIKLFLP